MAGKKIELEEEAISEILVADTASELGAEASDVRRGTTTTTASLSRIRHNKHWPANLTALPSLFFLWPKKGHTVRQM
jgi:hypothetical protein